jgi:hypothetical protein
MYLRDGQAEGITRVLLSLIAGGRGGLRTTMAIRWDGARTSEFQTTACPIVLPTPKCGLYDEKGMVVLDKNGQEPQEAPQS